MWVTPIQRLSANSRLVTCNPETCDLRGENRVVQGCDLQTELPYISEHMNVCVCVYYYLGIKDNMSGLAEPTHANSVYELCLGVSFKIHLFSLINTFV